ncbi:twin BRCT domain [Teratosphaeria destructans]|uniref:Twin BRCT domain n=1 Tax=Teratosphaeria destructans TaxID=418781 RepID=A0A9W7SQ65_9PEZI|nr:twin BRCT domain [Teratosphaeria destructans]
MNVDAVDRLPLQGVILCCTSLPTDVRTRLADIASELGAEHKLDLTSDVTHLIVGRTTTAKYRYVAKERPDIKVVQQEWIEAVRQSWMEGGEVDVAGLEEQHKLPVFHNLRICVTGFQDQAQREVISRTVQEQGAKYDADLTKAVTHLIAAAPEGAKYNAAKQWNIHVVSLQWFWDGLKRGMALEESLYDPLTPTEQQGRGAFRTEVRPRVCLGKRTREDEVQSLDQRGQRKLRRTASTRLNSQSQDLWQDMSARDTTITPRESDQWQETTGGPEQSARPCRQQVQIRQSDAFKPEPHEPREGLFSGRYILIRGFPREKARRLQDYLVPNGASIVESATALDTASEDAFFRSRYLLVPHAAIDGSVERSDLPPGTELVTEWWVERCIQHKTFLDPADDVLSRPLWDAKIADFAGVSISTTGFQGVNLRQTAEAVKLMGAKYDEHLVPSTSVLVSASDNVKKEKAFYASKHNIPVVSAEWFWQCLKQNKRFPYDDFRFKLPSSSTAEVHGAPWTSNPARDSNDLLQRGKETKAEAALKRLSNTRTEHLTPPLPLHANKPAPRHASKPLFIHEDEDEPAATMVNEQGPSAPQPGLGSPKRSQPLQMISSNLSPWKSGQAESQDDNKAEKKIKPATRTEDGPVTALDSPKTTPPHQEEELKVELPHRDPRVLTANLASILQQQMSSRSEHSSTELPQKRKHRPLGRSASGIGARTVSAPDGSPFLPSDLYISGSAADGFGTPKTDDPLPPSTQLGYDSADAEQNRLLIEQRMKVKLRDESGGRRVASVGTVRDSIEKGGGVAGRVRGRHRTK